VDTPLRDAYQWSDAVDAAVKDVASSYQSVRIGLPLIPPRSESPLSFFLPDLVPYTIDADRSKENPTVIFLTREDRTLVSAPWLYRLQHQASRRQLRGWKKTIAQDLGVLKLAERLVLRWQCWYVSRLYRHLSRKCPGLTFRVQGIGTTGTLDKHIIDDRTERPNEATELRWVRALSEAEVVIGTFGSNMLFPSMLSGSVVDLLHQDTFRKVGADLVPHERSVMLGIFRYRLLPLPINARLLASYIASMISYAPEYKEKFEPAASYDS
jgi:hypothetical protein